MQAIPWSDEALAIRRPDWGLPRERVIVAKGTLAAVIDQIAATIVHLGPTLSISLPDRRVTPFQYDLSEIGALVAARQAGAGQA